MLKNRCLENDDAGNYSSFKKHFYEISTSQICFVVVFLPLVIEKAERVYL